MRDKGQLFVRPCFTTNTRRASLRLRNGEALYPTVGQLGAALLGSGDVLPLIDVHGYKGEVDGGSRAPQISIFGARLPSNTKLWTGFQVAV